MTSQTSLLRTGQPSVTALAVATLRAAHQLLDDPLVLDDPFALRILGPAREAALRADPYVHNEPHARSLRGAMVVRSRFAEDELARSVAAGTRQYVVLGAGLDTFACRNPFAALGLRVFEVDHPATQAWKHGMLAEAALPHPACLTYAPVDFEHEHQTLGNTLETVGFEPNKKTFFSWLGVVPYLTLDAFRTTLAFTASLPAGSGIAFDYGLPRELLSKRGKAGFDYLSSRVRRAGEPFQLFFTPQQVSAELTAAGYTSIEDLNPASLTARYFSNRGDSLALRGEMGHMLCAWL